MPSTPSRRPLTVLQIIPALDAGGAERAAIDIAAALAARGDRALVASEGGRLETELMSMGGELVRLPAASKNPLTLAANVFRLAGLIRRRRIDLVHARSRAPAWSAVAACRITATPFVTTFHGIYGEPNAAKKLYNSVMVRGDAVIANSRYTARLIAARYQVPDTRLEIIPRGIDLDAFAPDRVAEARREALRLRWGLRPGERVVLNLARLAHWKGQEILIEAAALPPLADVPALAVVLAGDPQGRDGYLEQLRRRIGERGLQQRMRIVGHCDDVPAALTLADVSVIASTEPEAFGRTAVEAAAMGVPVVATALGATDETVLAPPAVPLAQRSGWLVQPGDAAALGAAIGAALALSREERERLAVCARRHAARFATAAMQAATLSLYDRLLSHARHADSFPKR